MRKHHSGGSLDSSNINSGPIEPYPGPLYLLAHEVGHVLFFRFLSTNPNDSTNYQKRKKRMVNKSPNDRINS